MVGSTLLLVAFALLPAVVALQPNAAPRNFGRRQCAAGADNLLNAAADDSFEGSIAQFAPKRMLPQVRGQRIKIQEQLAGAVAGEDYVLAAQLRDDLAELRQKDPAVMAAQLRDDLARHIKRERYGRRRSAATASSSSAASSRSTSSPACGREIIPTTAMSSCAWPTRATLSSRPR